jgi:hypothetical protein
MDAGTRRFRTSVRTFLNSAVFDVAVLRHGGKRLIASEIELVDEVDAHECNIECKTSLEKKNGGESALKSRQVYA